MIARGIKWQPILLNTGPSVKPRFLDAREARPGRESLRKGMSLIQRVFLLGTVVIAFEKTWQPSISHVGTSLRASDIREKQSGSHVYFVFSNIFHPCPPPKNPNLKLTSVRKYLKRSLLY